MRKIRRTRRTPLSYALRRVRHRKSFDIWSHQVGNYDAGTEIDIRVLPGYQVAKTTRTLAVTAQAINPDTGFPGIYVRVPFYPDPDFLGRASANITMDVLSRFFEKHRTSAHSTCAYHKSNPGILVAQSAQNRATENASNCLGEA